MEKRKRILSVIDGLGFAGDESRLLSFSRTVNPDLFEHSVLTLNPLAYTSAHQFQARREQFLRAGIRVDDLSDVAPERQPDFRGVPGRLYGKTGLLRRTRRLAAVIRKWNVDIVDGHLESAGLVAVLAGRITAKPTSITIYCGESIGERVVWPRPTRVALKLATGILTDSEVRANEMRSLVPRQASKVTVIPNGISRPQSSRSSLEMRKLLGLPENPAMGIVGMVGRFVEYKGHRVLIQAARKVIEQEPHVCFLAIGFTPSESYRDSLNKLARDLGIAERVVLAEYPGDIADVWNVIDIHVHASLFDSLPISIAEGMSLGKPAVVTSAGGIPEIVKNGQTGLVVPPGDADALAAGLLDVLTNPDLARRLGESARRRYEAFYRPEQMTRAMEQYFFNLASPKGQPRKAAAAAAS
jgi:glycosyltransferase involved in cell wall biosynthesis